MHKLSPLHQWLQIVLRRQLETERVVGQNLHMSFWKKRMSGFGFVGRPLEKETYGNIMGLKHRGIKELVGYMHKAAKC